MEKQVESSLKNLLEAIRNSESYREFEEKKEVMADHPELKQRLDEFRKKVFLMQNSNEAMNLMDQLSDLYKEKVEIYENQIMGDYLLAELNMCRMLQTISTEVLNVTDMEIEAFENSITI